LDGAIVVTNNGGSQGFQAGQFGYVPSVNQPPVIVPSNPTIQFVPPPSYNPGSGGPVAGPGAGKTVDCIVRYKLEATDCGPTTPLAENNDAVIKQLFASVPDLQKSVDKTVGETVQLIGTALSNPNNVVSTAPLTNPTLVGTNIQTGLTNGQLTITNNGTHETVTIPLSGPSAGTPQTTTSSGITPSAGGGNEAAPRSLQIQPTITSLSPASGVPSGGNTLTITGTHLADATGVTIAGNDATDLTVVDDAHLTVTVPSYEIGAVNVVVTTPNGTAKATYTYVARTTIGQISPNTGDDVGGTVVTITGTNFSSIARVTVGGSQAEFQPVSDTEITLTMPSHAAGPVTIAIETEDGNAEGTFTYQQTF
jgi:hypothetical protein